MPRLPTKSEKSGSASGKVGATNSGKTGSKKSDGSGNGIQQDTMLEKFVLDQLKDIYWAEKHLTKAIPKLAKAATSEELKQALQDHLTVTEVQVTRLEQVFEIMGKKAQAKKCEAMEGLSKEADTIVEETEKGSMTRDAAIIMAAQKVEHYEIATYGGLVQLTKTLGMTEVADLLTQTLQEEKEADETLTSVAENDINLKAEEEGQPGE